MDKKEAQIIIQNIDKVLGKSVQKEELEETRLNEIQIPTMGAFLRGHRIINQYMLLAMTVFPKGTTAHKIIATFQKPLGAFVDTMDEFYSNHKVLFGLLFGTMFALDVFGTSAVVAKEKFLVILRKKIAEKYELEDAGAPKAIDVAPADDDDIELPEPLQEQVSRMKDLAGINKKVL
jgi:hypothetical protein